MFDDDHRGPVCKIPEDIEGIVRIGQVCLAGMLSGLQQFDVRGKVSARQDGFGLSQNQVAVDQPIQGRLLTRIFSVAQSFSTSSINQVTFS